MYTLLTKRNIRKGFTLVETLVAISILLLAITGPLSLAFKSISYAKFAGDRSIATFLAQDAMEYIIAKKNYNIASSGSGNWMDDLDSGNECKVIGSDKGCYIDTTTDLGSPTITKCPEAGCPPIQFDGEFYQYQSGDETEFVRTITIETPSNNPDERIITVTVTFDSRVLSDTYEIRLSVFNSNV